MHALHTEGGMVRRGDRDGGFAGVDGSSERGRKDGGGGGGSGRLGVVADERIDPGQVKHGIPTPPARCPLHPLRTPGAPVALTAHSPPSQTKTNYAAFSEPKEPTPAHFPAPQSPGSIRSM